MLLLGWCLVLGVSSVRAQDKNVVEPTPEATCGHGFDL
jgi:hypothetical protein